METENYKTIILIYDLINLSGLEKQPDLLINLIKSEPEINLFSLYYNYKDEFQTNIFQINDNKGREAFLSKNFKILSYSSFFEKNKELLRERWKTHPNFNYDYYTHIWTLLFLIRDIERDLKDYCNEFDIPYNKLVGKYETYNNVKIYDMKKLALYIGDIQEPTQLETNKKPKVKAFWKQGKKSLKKFHSLLQNDYEFIDKIDQDVFVSHFDGTFTPKTPKINWVDEQTVFVKMFDTINFCIDKKYLHTTDETVSTAELSKHFTIKGAETNSKKLRQTRNSIKGIAPKMKLEIDNISKELEKTL